SFVDLPDYFHARYYDPGLGRFLSVDPIIDVQNAAKNPQAWNRYVYVRNNPVRFTDPTGRYTCDGSEWQCKAIEASVAMIRQAAKALTEQRKPGATVLNAIATSFGKLGEKNGVTVAVASTNGAGGAGTIASRFWPLSKSTTTTVDPAFLVASMTAKGGQVN